MFNAHFPIFLSVLLGGGLMTEAIANQSLQLDILDPGTGKITVLLKANSPHAQRVSYELLTTGTSNSALKGSTYLKANHSATLSNVSFSGGSNWCVSLIVEEELGAQYTVRKGSACS
jgi:hypothetical protein